jgi:hypothetical protein
MFEYIIVACVYIGILFILSRLGILKFVQKKGYTHKHTPRSLKLSFGLFHGFDYYHFRLPKRSQLRMKYAVDLEEGTLKLELRSRKGTLFTKTFDTGDEGEVMFETQGSKHAIRVEARKAKGSCNIQFLSSS